MKNKQELWRIIPEYPQYMVSNFGNVMSLPIIGKSDNKFIKSTRQRPGRMLKPRTVPSGGHQQVSLSYHKKEMYVHRLVAMAWLKRRKHCNQVMHIDDNPKNNHVDNLKWGTHLENMRWIWKDSKFAKLKNKEKTIYNQSVLLQEKGNYSIRKSLLVLGKKYDRSFSTLWVYYCKGKKILNKT